MSSLYTSCPQWSKFFFEALGLALCFGQQHYGWLTLGVEPDTLITHAYPIIVQWTDVLIAFGLVALIGLLTALVTSLTMRRRLK